MWIHFTRWKLLWTARNWHRHLQTLWVQNQMKSLSAHLQALFNCRAINLKSNCKDFLTYTELKTSNTTCLGNQIDVHASTAELHLYICLLYATCSVGRYPFSLLFTSFCFSRVMGHPREESVWVQNHYWMLLPARLWTRALYWWWASHQWHIILT